MMAAAPYLQVYLKTTYFFPEFLTTEPPWSPGTAHLFETWLLLFLSFFFFFQMLAQPKYVFQLPNSEFPSSLTLLSLALWLPVARWLASMLSYLK